MADSTTTPSTFNTTTFIGSTPTRRFHRRRQGLRVLVVALTLGVLAAFVPVASPSASANPGDPTPEAVVDVQVRVEAALAVADRIQSCPLAEKVRAIDLTTADKEVRETITACLDALAELADRSDDVDSAYSDYLWCLQQTQGDCFLEEFALSAAELLLSRQLDAVIAACFDKSISNGF